MQVAHDVAGLALLLGLMCWGFDAYEWHIEMRARARARAEWERRRR
jgi:hypothetical protein